MPEIVADLRHKNAHMIDAKDLRRIKQGSVSYRRYDDTNAINCYDDT